ncbi:MAG: PIN domain-containing protein [Polyangiales bacterium]
MNAPVANPSEVVLDASALLAFLQAEPGADVVEQHLEGAHISLVNWSEVLSKLLAYSVQTGGMRAELTMLGLNFCPPDLVQAERAAALRPPTQSLGLSLGDRFCLALAEQRQAVALTTDRAWGQIEVDIAVRVLR